MRVHIYPDIGGDLATGFPFRMKADMNGVGARQARNNENERAEYLTVCRTRHSAYRTLFR
jgi:hypothetical protein